MSGHAYTAEPARPARARTHELSPGAGGALRVAALCALAAALVWVLAELVPAGHVRDAILLRHFTLLSGPHVDGAANALLALLSPVPLACWGLALVLFALARGLRREALAVSLIVAFAPLSADRLKPLLAHAHAGSVHIAAASWPSGHSAAALALALCAVLLAPPRTRVPVALAGAAFALAVGVALLVRAWHMPSDVLGGYLVAALWAALAVAGLRASARRWPARSVGR